MTTVSEKKARTTTRTIAPRLGIHLPWRNATIATITVIQMKSSLNA